MYFYRKWLLDRELSLFYFFYSGPNVDEKCTGQPQLLWLFFVFRYGMWLFACVCSCNIIFLCVHVLHDWTETICKCIYGFLNVEFVSSVRCFCASTWAAGNVRERGGSFRCGMLFTLLLLCLLVFLMAGYCVAFTVCGKIYFYTHLLSLSECSLQRLHGSNWTCRSTEPEPTDSFYVKVIVSDDEYP